MKINSFNEYFVLGILLASVASLILTKNLFLSLKLLEFLGDVLILWLWIYISICIHEFGHAIAGWIVKFPIAKITIGFGSNIFKYKFKSTTLVVNQGIDGGLTHPGTMSQDFLRLRYFFFILGGVGLQAICLLVVKFIITVIEYAGLFSFNYPWSKIVYFFFFSNIALMVINLIPFQANIMGIPMPTDGLQLLTIFFIKREKIQEILLSGEILDGMECLEEQDFSKAELIFRECSLKYPALMVPKINLSAALIRQNKVDESIELLCELLTEVDNDTKKSKDMRRIFILNNLAWGYLLKGIKEPNFLKLADEYSEKAIALNNQAPALVGTRACVLIEIGELENGINLLKNRVNLHKAVNTKTNHAIAFLYLAYAYYLNGNEKKYKKYWEKIKDHKDFKSGEYQILYEHIVERTNYFYAGTKEL